MTKTKENEILVACDNCDGDGECPECEHAYLDECDDPECPICTSLSAFSKCPNCDGTHICCQCEGVGKSEEWKNG